MRKHLILCATVVLLSFVGCQKDLRDDVNDLLDRVSKLEKVCEQANSDIVDLKQIVSLLEANDYITSVNELSDKSGYAINFLKGNTIVIKHGTNGDYPVIGVEELDGVFYWTQKVGDNPASWITDSKGNKIQATGISGKTPAISISTDGYWMVDYGEGPKELLVNGKPIQAKGKDGQNGIDGVDGYSPFESVIDKGDYIELKLTTGTILKLRKENSVIMKVIFDVDNNNLIANLDYINEKDTVTYRLENLDQTVKIDFEASNGWEIKHNPSDKSIVIIPLRAWSEEGRIIASLYKDNRLISQFRYFAKANSLDYAPLTDRTIKAEPQPLEAIGGKVPVTINATFPENWFNEYAIITVTPVLRYAGGEAFGTSYTYQGELAKGNNQVIPQRAGANVTMKSSFTHKPEMKKSELYLIFDMKIRNKAIKLPEVKIGEGVISTS